MRKTNPRKNKSKSEIIKDTEKVMNANRMRIVVEKTVFPFLIDLKEPIGYAKIFLQTCATVVESKFIETQKTVKVGDLMEKLRENFKSDDEKVKKEFERYIKFFELMKDESVHDFSSMIQSMPRVIEQYFLHEIDQKKVEEIDVKKLLG